MAAGHCCIFLWSIIIISANNDTINVAHAEKSSFKNPSKFNPPFFFTLLPAHSNLLSSSDSHCATNSIQPLKYSQDFELPMSILSFMFLKELSKKWLIFEYEIDFFLSRSQCHSTAKHSFHIISV